jgi:RNA polymerase sigma factor FliA
VIQRPAVPLTDQQRQLAEAHLELAEQAVGVFRRKHDNWIERDDLRSIAFTALVEAAGRFDPRVGATFRQFAWQRISGAFIDEIRARHGRLGVGKTHRVPPHLFDSIDAVCDGGREPTVKSGEDQVLDRDEMDTAIAGLRERDRFVITLYFHESLTQHEIGELLEVTESRVNQLLGQALRRLREELVTQQRPPAGQRSDGSGR